MRPVQAAGQVITLVLVALLLGGVGLFFGRGRGAGDAAITSQPATPIVPTRTALRGAAGMLAGLAPNDLVVQLEYEPTFSTPEEFQPFGRLPPLTVFADGRTYYVEGSGPRQAMEARLTADEIATLLQQVYDRGFGHLQSHPEQCRRVDDRIVECTDDASFSVIRARLPDGTVRTVRNYSTYANDPDALADIREVLGSFRHPATARPYHPARATLFLGPVYGDDSATPYRSWPLNAARLQPPDAEQQTWAIVVTGDEWDALVKVSGPYLGARYFEQDGRRHAAFVTPWLPGVDYTADIAAYGDPQPTVSVPAASPP